MSVLNELSDAVTRYYFCFRFYEDAATRNAALRVAPEWVRPAGWPFVRVRFHGPRAVANLLLRYEHRKAGPRLDRAFGVAAKRLGWHWDVQSCDKNGNAKEEQG